MAHDQHENPPSYQNTLDASYPPVAYTDARDNESDLQHSDYDSVLAPSEANEPHNLIKSLLFIFLICLFVFATLFYDPAHDENHEIRREWENLTPSTKCLRYGTREYSATLSHDPSLSDPLAECWKKSTDIHGRQIPPSRCETQGSRTVKGYWIVDFKEPSCVTWWRGYDNKGCLEPGIHRYESVLENLQWGDDWRVMCATTPGHVQGRNFDGPTSCASWISGINGIWLVEDENCP